jgi:hypothetical protein
MTTKRPIPPGRELLSKGNATAQRVLEQSRIMADVVGRHARTLPDALNPKAPLESLGKASRAGPAEPGDGCGFLYAGCGAAQLPVLGHDARSRQ